MDSSAPAITAPSRLGDRFGAFLDRRIPPGPQITLSQSNIFIFPTTLGFTFGGLLIVLILGAINYQNSLVYGTAFLLGSMFIVTILYTFRNLSGLSLEVADSQPGFVGEDICIAVRVKRPKGTAREGIQVGWPNGFKQWAEIFDSEADEVKLYVRGEQRGWLVPGRLLVETYYPLGLLRAWTWVDIQARAVVYPKPIFESTDYSPQHRSRGDGELVDPLGSEDFVDIRQYVSGDPIRNILWRSYARSENLVVKKYASYIEPRLWFDYEFLPGDREEKLSRITGFALQATQHEREFGVRLPGCEIAPGVGPVHLQTVLRELALFGLERG